MKHQQTIQSATDLLGTMQKPCASMPSGGLNFERKFSMAMAAVNSTILPR